jgi:flagellar hook-associated protein 2
MATSGTTPITFNGSSTYSSSFQQVITRAVGIASLPMQILQNQVTSLNSQASAVSGLAAAFTTIQSDLQGLDTAVAGSPSAQSSDPTAVSTTAAAGALNGTYTIQVDDVGSSTTTLSPAGLITVTDPTTGNISSATSFTLTVNGTATTITPSGTSLEDLANAINSAGAGAQATIVNVGSNTSPDYRLAVSGTSLGADTIQLSDGSPTGLLDTLATGSDAQYKVNGSTTDVQSTSNQVTLSPGLTVNLLAQTSTPATITVTSDYSSLQNALSSFVTDYNSAVSALQQNVGQGGGPLTGDSLIYTLSDVLDQIANYTGGGSGGVSSLSDLGVSLQVTGQLSFDPSTFATASQSDISNFLGSIESSSGFLSAANNTLNSVSDPTNGLFSAESSSIQDQITSDNTQIANDQARVTALQTSLQAQLSQADAAIATLQSQDTYYQELFQAQYGSTGGTNNANNGEG